MKGWYGRLIMAGCCVTLCAATSIASEVQKVWQEPRQYYPVVPAPEGASMTIDGNLDEWQDAAVLFPLPRPKDRLQQLGWTGIADCFATFRLVRDAERLYIAAEVRDDALEAIHADPGMFWANDGIEIFLDFDLKDRSTQAFNKDDVQLVVCPLSLATEGRADGWMSPQSYAGPVDVASRRSENGYVIEMAVTLPEAYRGLLSDGGRIGLDVAVNDCDAGNWQTQLRWFPWGKSSEDARARHICKFVAKPGDRLDRRFESTAWTAAPTHDFVVAGRPCHVVVAAAASLKDPRVDIIYHDETGRELTLASDVAVAGVTDIEVTVPPLDGKLVYGGFISIYGRSAARNGILADYAVTVADPGQFAATAGDLAESIAGITRGSRTLIGDADEAVAQQDADAFRKAVDGLALLKAWGERPEFVNPPVARMDKARKAGEKADLEVYGIAGDYASFPDLYRTENELLLSFPVQPVELAGRTSEHVHHQLFSDTCWVISRDEGLSWSIARARPEHAPVLHATRSIEGLVPPAVMDERNANRPGRGQAGFQAALKTEEAVQELGEGATFHVFDFGQDANGEVLAIGYGKAPTLSKERVIILLAGGKDGTAWTYRSAIASPGRFNLEEPAIYTGMDGHLVCVMRTGWEMTPELERQENRLQGRANFHWSYEPFNGMAGYGGHLVQSISTDNGRTWSKPESTGLWGHPAHMLRLQSGKVLMVYGHRTEPWSVRAVLSHDDGKTWDPETVRTLREFKPGIPDLGYPVITQLPDGTIACTYYGYRTAAVLRYPTPHSIFVSLFDEQWLEKGAAPAATPDAY
jgi:hypothetical protein